MTPVSATIKCTKYNTTGKPFETMTALVQACNNRWFFMIEIDDEEYYSNACFATKREAIAFAKTEIVEFI